MRTKCYRQQAAMRRRHRWRHRPVSSRRRRRPRPTAIASSTSALYVPRLEKPTEFLKKIVCFSVLGVLKF